MFTISNGNSYCGSGFVAPADDAKVRSLPWPFRLGVPGFEGLLAVPLTPGWRKSSHSTNNGSCVEVAGLLGGGAAVRDSKDRSGPVLEFSPGAWSVFTGGIKDGTGTR